MRLITVIWLFLFSIANTNFAQSISDATQSCIDCHESINPGIVQDWLSSRHAKVDPAEALKKKIGAPNLQRKHSRQSGQYRRWLLRMSWSQY